MRLGSLEAEQKHLDIVLKRVPNVVRVLRLKVKIFVAQSAFEEAAAIAIDVSKFPNSEALGLVNRYLNFVEGGGRVLLLNFNGLSLPYTFMKGAPIVSSNRINTHGSLIF